MARPCEHVAEYYENERQQIAAPAKGDAERPVDVNAGRAGQVEKAEDAQNGNNKKEDNENSFFGFLAQGIIFDFLVLFFSGHFDFSLSRARRLGAGG
jgi:hypothetical protein